MVQLKPLSQHSYSEDTPVTVTVCCLAFNHEAFIVRCLEGIMEQCCDFRVEVIVHDDASTDRTPEIIKDYAARYPQIIHPVLQQENMYSKGVNPHYAYMLPISRGEFMAICDGDDFWADPDKLARQVAVLRAEPDVSLTYGRVYAISENEEIQEDYVGGSELDLSPAELKSGPAINTLTACFRNIFRGKPPPEFLRASTIGDITLWACLGYYGRGKFLDELPPAYYRRHEKGLLSMQTPNKRIAMALVAQANIAVYHKLHGDDEAHRESTRRLLSWINALGDDQYLDRSLDEVSLSRFLRLRRRARRARK